MTGRSISSVRVGDVLRGHWDRRLPMTALRYAVGVAVAWGLGSLFWGAAAVTTASGAVNAAGVSESGKLGRPRTVMALSTVSLAGAAFLGSVTSRSLVWSSVALAGCAVVVGLLSAKGSDASTIGNQALIGFVTLGHFAPPVRQAGPVCLLLVAGGAVQILLDMAVSTRVAHRLLGGAGPLEHLLVDPPSRPAVTWRAARRWLSGLFHPSRRVVLHAARLTGCLVLAHLVGALALQDRTYWIALTVIIVLKPHWGKTLSQGISRWVGTLAGAGLAGWLLPRVPLNGGWQVVAITVTVWAMLTVRQVNYSLYCCFLTLYVVTFLEASHAAPHDSATLRLVNTTIGGLLCLAVHWTTKRFDEPAGECGHR